MVKLMEDTIALKALRDLVDNILKWHKGKDFAQCSKCGSINSDLRELAVTLNNITHEAFDSEDEELLGIDEPCDILFRQIVDIGFPDDYFRDADFAAKWCEENEYRYSQELTDNFSNVIYLKPFKDVVLKTDNICECFTTHKELPMVNKIEPSPLTNFGDLVKITLECMDQHSIKPVLGEVIPTYFEELDLKIYGLEFGKITAIVGRPSMGKTLFAMNIVRRVVSNGKRVMVFSLSLCKQEWTKCFLCCSANLDLHKTRIGDLSAEETAKLNEAAQKSSSLLLFVRDEDRRMEGIIKTVSESIKDHKIELVLIDGMSDIYGNTLQSMKSRGQRYDKQLKMLKEMAVQWHIPILITQTLSRRAERNPYALIPKYEYGLREGNLSQHADRILQLYREEYYNPKKYNRGVMDIRIPAMKYGENHTNAKVRFDRSTGVVQEIESVPFDPDGA